MKPIEIPHKRGRRATFYDVVVRGWVCRGEKIVRILTWSNYEPCYYGGFQRDFIFRLPDNDPRPRGLHLAGSEFVFDWYASLPVGQWVEVVSADRSAA